MKMTFEKWQQARRWHNDLREDPDCRDMVGEDVDGNTEPFKSDRHFGGMVYPRGSLIERRVRQGQSCWDVEGYWYLIIERSEYEGTLEELERILYQWCDEEDCLPDQDTVTVTVETQRLREIRDWLVDLHLFDSTDNPTDYEWGCRRRLRDDAVALLQNLTDAAQQQEVTQ